ncbi:hypothetical protein MTHERMOG20_01730 [Moorella thermoacetica]|uniref:Transcobalamin-like C-terminal domain-containing protein n=1 Tax=Moorella thermoacetica (strain ATCC 39073 / JCM 9320) TaxID=264732 RepID=Q2RIH1_MOOTA|nr:DUF4430 domain-containing protein [Moorella thermoacetica]AKX94240.1 hypothetical protein MOTHE_c14470 [Moorella thermoacetica]AKX96879.1 hypothetical protein MOTHA_c15330 [Moorella thermoacetica]OIQ58049.1 hypothetical protein MOCA_04740 [Moorella thermoacetica]QDA00708.1 hypothetical protein MothHH_01569 [Moorella thermoacetica]TYL11603.1 hypothetical protein MOOCA_04740 [Moorella thermoacetica]
MQKKIGYLAAALVVLLALIGPAVSKQGISPGRQPGPDTTLSQSRAPSPGGSPAADGRPENTGDQKSSETQTPASITAGKQAGGSAVNGGANAAAPAGSPGVTPSSPQTGGAIASGVTGLAGNQANDKGAPAPPAAEGYQVHVAIVGMKGQLLFGPTTVTVNKNNRWGLTALGALEATGLKYSLAPGYGNFVQSIAGQANKGMCGWMYKVNDEAPMVAASEKKVNPGDKIIWWYSESINNAGPTWEGLKEAAP